MSRRRDLEQHRDSLGEIGEILSSMKTLAYMETRKLSRFLSAEQLVVESIERVAADFLEFHPDTLPDPGETAPVYLLIGSERGFCGDFNRALVEWLAAERGRTGAGDARLVVVGHKLRALLETDASAAAFVEGASVAEDVPAVLPAVIDALTSLHGGLAALRLSGVRHGPGGIEVNPLLPPFARERETPPGRANPPLLNLTASEFLLELIDHYLFAVLNHSLYVSLMEENHRRINHLERAVRHLDDESRDLTRRCRSLRQEEITEEIEVILLSAASIGVTD